MTAGSNPSPPPARRGCLFYALLSAAIVGFFLLLCAGIGYYTFKKLSQRWVQDYTDTAPTLVEQVVYPAAQLESLRQRLAAFQTALDKGSTVEELTLTAEDLNALIHEDQNLKGKLFVRIEDDRIKGEVSVPLVDIGPFKLAGRYLNGHAVFKVSLARGKAEIHLEDVQVKGRRLPRMFLREFQKENLADRLADDPATAARIARFDSIQLTNGAVILRNKVTGP